MSDQPEDQSAESATAWPQAEQAPAWEQIADQAESSAPGPAGPGASSQEAPAELEPATEAGRSRRPTSLREQYVQDAESVPRRKLSAPAFPSAPSVPGSRVTPSVSAAPEPGNPGQMPGTAQPASAPQTPHMPNPASLLGKIPRDKIPTDKISMDKLPLDKLPTDKLPVDRLRTLTKQRPEVGLGLAFAGGLVIATILKRLGRR